VTRPLEGLAAVADRYDVFLLDMWGCIHDGYRVFPGVHDLTKRLRAMGKRTVVLSNAPRLVPILVRQMQPTFGIPADAFDGIVTSGEAAWQALIDDTHKLGRRFLHVGMEANIVDPRTIGYEMVDDVADADFVFATGAAGDGTLDLDALAAAIRTLPDHARPRRLRLVAEVPITDGYRPIKRPVAALGFAPGPGVWRWDNHAQQLVIG